MDKIAGCGLEVSARELVVALEDQRVQRYANTAAGHRKLQEWFWKRPECMGWMWRCC
jgi:hypothetical protein